MAYGVDLLFSSTHTHTHTQTHVEKQYLIVNKVWPTLFEHLTDPKRRKYGLTKIQSNCEYQFFVYYCEDEIYILAPKLSNFIVIVTNIAFPITSLMITINDADRCGQYPGYPIDGTVGRVLCSPSPIRGRYVYITLPAVQHLMLCEVEVFTGKGKYSYQCIV